ncbi:hypothetical protein B0H15DRAFT_828932 [Mycena belliarum]|uniref:DUF7719 domain-containing protein n=1 Tax=Mycena belliarum TaxID=1033014 RepID=A0AAD6XV86_9AGAR|nr:hypothetical protein B0H15DRAFT_828932 [Mycena belliae]
MPPAGDSINIPQEEQWRLINDSGVLKKVEIPSPAGISLGEELFNAVLFITPFTFLLLLMDVLIYQQYGQEPNLKTIVDRMVSGIPILSVFVFYTSRYKRDQRMQRLLFLIGTAAGSRMLFLIKRGSYLVNMQQCPPLVTLWVYIVVQLDLGLAVLNLASVGAFVWWKGLELFS